MGIWIEYGGVVGRLLYGVSSVLFLRCVYLRM